MYRRMSTKVHKNEATHVIPNNNCFKLSFLKFYSRLGVNAIRLEE